MYITDTKAKVLEYLRQNGSATNAQLQALTGISSRGITKQLKELKRNGKIIKIKHRVVLSGVSGSKSTESTAPGVGTWG